MGQKESPLERRLTSASDSGTAHKLTTVFGSGRMDVEVVGACLGRFRERRACPGKRESSLLCFPFL